MHFGNSTALPIGPKKLSQLVSRRGDQWITETDEVMRIRSAVKRLQGHSDWGAEEERCVRNVGLLWPSEGTAKSIIPRLEGKSHHIDIFAAWTTQQVDVRSFQRDINLNLGGPLVADLWSLLAAYAASDSDLVMYLLWLTNHLSDLRRHYLKACLGGYFMLVKTPKRPSEHLPTVLTAGGIGGGPPSGPPPQFTSTLLD
ncbi:hypothetical protein B0H17DRAFT_1144253 [Mycena rosella]|uniref:Uncharacterized protein n=1 Tax=Mycena rosella TaxID=1033263 RepID=A0AAD7G3L8_MYCRO|nr:hypothetical protein B0H17DRAFT_1144253 [Mycena rosella]